MDLQNIRENRQAAKRRKIKFTTLKQEIQVDRESWLERKNMHLERMLEKAKNEKNMLRNMAYHYVARNMVRKARIGNLKAKLKREIREKRKIDFRSW